MGISTLSVRMQFEDQKVLGFASIGPAYMGIGSAFENPPRLLWIINLTDALLQFSTDGIHDKFPLPPGSNVLFDVTTNSPQNLGCYFSIGDRIYVKEIGIPSSGNVYVSSLYGSTY